MGQELEWKYAADPASQAAALALPAVRGAQDGPAQVFSMRTSYYDTPDGALAARKWTLRLRMENDRAVVCCKTRLENGLRGEWELEADDPAAALPALTAAGAPAELLELRALAPVCGAAFTRRALTLRLEGAVCELACDSGTLFGPTETCPLCEIEIEHKSGDAAVSRAFAEATAAALGLPPELRSKAQRAFALR